MVVSMRSKKCLARVGKTKSGKLKFCGQKTTYNDLCRKHDRRFGVNNKFNQELS